jgi:solute:Na+ symporter, SSS family
MNEAFKLFPIDLVIFVLFLVSVVALGLFKSRGEGKDSESYFLAGRGLKWWLIGVSLIAANISSEQFVGMSGSAADYMGMAISSYEWMAAITLVVVAFCFLPYFLRAGIFTIPHFLEHRYNSTARTMMSVFMMVILIGVSLTGVIYAGALTMSELFAEQAFFGVHLGLNAWCWIIGLTAAVYVAAGGLNASAWADLIQGIALVIGGALITYFAFDKLGSMPVAELMAGGPNPHPVDDTASGMAKLVALNHEKLNMILPRTDKNIPWTALIIGLWIPNFYYWGLNQYITQRILGSASLKEGQKGIVFAAGMKLLIPFIVVIPGIMAFNMFSKDLAVAKERSNERMVQSEIRKANSVTIYKYTEAWAANHPELLAQIETHNAKVIAAAPKKVAEVEVSSGYKFDAALTLLIKKVLPPGSGLAGFVLAALLGAIVSSLAAVLNAASTIFTMDIYQKHVNPTAAQKSLVTTGRICVGIFALIGCIAAPLLDQFGSIFKYIQEFQGFVSPGILAVFVFGLLNRRAPGYTGVVGLLLNPLLYWLFGLIFPNVAFLDRMAICFFIVIAVMWVIGMIKPLAQPVVFKTNTTMNLEPSQGAKIAGMVIVVATVILYFIFSPLGIAR